ncbi:hypothetical protein EMIT0194P_30504 [Pseudomonas serbica]
MDDSFNVAFEWADLQSRACHHGKVKFCRERPGWQSAARSAKLRSSTI